jgi:hypothetical protein
MRPDQKVSIVKITQIHLDDSVIPSIMDHFCLDTNSSGSCTDRSTSYAMFWGSLKVADSHKVDHFCIFKAFTFPNVNLVEEEDVA